MSYFRNTSAELDESAETGTEPDELLHHQEDGGPSAQRPPRPAISELAGRVGRWFQGLDPEPEDGATVEHDVLGELDADEPAPQSVRVRARVRNHFGDRDDHNPDHFGDRDDHNPDHFGDRDDHNHGPDAGGLAPRFPLVRFGYCQADVDRRLAELEREVADRDRELDTLREQITPPMSITEEIERIGEQTASILVVAHDQAHQTTRRAQEQAERCIADAAANAVAITAEAKERLRELDDETDSVWRERERLLEDTRLVSVKLAAVVDEAIRRFPADADADKHTADASSAGHRHAP